MGCPRSDCLHLQKFWREIHGSKITRSSHVAIGNPLEMEIFNGKIICKNGGFWWNMVDVLKKPRLITRRWSIDQTWKKEKHTPESELANSEIRSHCELRLYRLCMPMPKIRNSCPHIDTGYIPLHSIHVTWCYVDVTCMSQTFWISPLDDKRWYKVHKCTWISWIYMDESWWIMDHITWPRSPRGWRIGVMPGQDTAVDELREETNKSPSKCLDVSSPESTGLPLVQLDISLTSAWHQLDISLTLALCDLEIHSTSHFQVKI